MKLLYLGMLSLLFGTIVSLGVVKGDIIDSDWGGFEDSRQEIDNSWENSYYSFETPKKLLEWEFSLIPDSIGRSIQLSLRILSLVTISIWGLFLIFLLFVCIYGKLTWKTKKYLIPSFKWIKKWLWIAFVLIVLWFLLEIWLRFNDCSLCGWSIQTSTWSYRPVYKNNLFWMIRFWRDIIYCIWLLLLSLIVLTAYYRLFRKLGWNRWYSVLWTIFFPIWVCILWFWKFQPITDGSENKDEKSS